MIITENANAMDAYCVPISATCSESVNSRRKRGMTVMHTIMLTTPWITEHAIPRVAAASALSISPAPR